MKGIQDMLSSVEHVFVGEGKQDAISILKADHRRIKALFLQWDKARGADKRQQILNAIIKELAIHVSVELDLVYPLLEESQQKKVVDRAMEAAEEHHMMKIIMTELATVSASSPAAKAKLAVLSEIVHVHFRQEEMQLLPALKKTDVDLERLGKQIVRRKEQLAGDISRTSERIANWQKAKATAKATAAAKAGKSVAKSGKADKATAKRATAKKATAKKATAKKVTAKKAVAKRISSRKGSARKAVAKKSAVKTAKLSKTTKITAGKKMQAGKMAARKVGRTAKRKTVSMKRAGANRRSRAA
jgi:hemerythrin superfamily protein